MPKTLKKYVPAAVTLAVLALLLWFAFRPLPKLIDIGWVTRGTFQLTLDNDGRTRVKERYEIRAPLTGILGRITLDPGDPVRAGETRLAMIDPLEPSLLDERTIAQAEAKVRAAEASVEASEREHDKADAELNLAVSEFKRMQGLVQDGLRPKADLERAERALRVAEESVASAKARQRIANFELEMAKAALLRTKPENGKSLEDRRLVLVAPIDGAVFRLLRESQGPVTIGEPLVELGDPHNLEVVADYLSTDAVRIEPGMRAQLEGWGGPRPLGARVRLVEPSGFTKISALGVEEQRVNVILDLTDPVDERRPLADGFRVEVRVETWTRENVLKLPEGALFPDGEAWAVFRIEGGKARRRSVEIGKRNGLEAELVAGLEEGDAVVLHPSDAIEDGVRVEQR